MANRSIKDIYLDLVEQRSRVRSLDQELIEALKYSGASRVSFPDWRSNYNAYVLQSDTTGSRDKYDVVGTSLFLG